VRSEGLIQVSNYQLHRVREEYNIRDNTSGFCLFIRNEITPKVKVLCLQPGGLYRGTERLQAVRVLTRHTTLSEKLPLHRGVPQVSNVSVMLKKIQSLV
jgi:hypothetical protein